MCRFVTTAEQDEHDSLPAREIQTVASANVDPHFTHPFTDGLHVTETSEASGLEAGKDPGLSSHVAQPQKPRVEDVSPLELVHECIVSSRILRVNVRGECSLTLEVTGAPTRRSPKIKPCAGASG